MVKFYFSRQRLETETEGGAGEAAARIRKSKTPRSEKHSIRLPSVERDERIVSPGLVTS